MAVTTKGRDFKMAFVIDADALRDVVELLSKEVLEQMEDSEASQLYPPEKRLEFTVELSDNTRLTTTSMDEILRLPNTPRRRITSVDIQTPYDASKIRASLRFRNDGSIPITYDLRGDDREVLSLSDKLDDHLVGLRPWYSPLARFSLLLLLAALLGIAFVMGNVLLAADYLFFPNIIAGNTGSNESDPSIEAVFWTFVLLLVGLIVLLDRMRLRVFPMGTFAIGQGKTRHETLGNVRAGILAVVLLPFVVGVVVNLIT